jgi:hypothetical protein
MFVSVMVCTLSVRPPPQRPTTKTHTMSLPKHPLIGYLSDVVGSCGANGMRISTLFPSEEKGLTPVKRECPGQRPGLHRWRCLPLTRTRCKPLTCDFATPRLLPAGCVPRDASAQRPGNLRGEADVVGDDAAPAAKAASQWCAAWHCTELAIVERMHLQLTVQIIGRMHCH